MTDDLETMLRASLQQRAEDVEPTPELWQQVQRRTARRRAMPLLVWTAAGVAAIVAVAVIGPGLLEGVEEGLVIDPAQSPSEMESPGDAAPGPVAASPLSHYVAVVDGRLVLRSLAGEESVLWEGESEVRTVAVRPGSTADEPVVAAITTAEGMVDLRILGGGTDGAVYLGPDAGDAAVVPTPVWSPDGSTVGTVVSSRGGAELVLADVAAMSPDGDTEPVRVSLGDVRDPAQLRLQDWAVAGDQQVLSFTSLGALYRSTIERSAEGGWIVSTPAVADGDGYVVDLATGADGTQYRLLAGGSSSGDAEDAGLALEFDNERIAFPDLPTASPADAWMTAVEAGAVVGLGSDARLVVRDREGDSDVIRVDGVSYAAWVPSGGVDAGVPPAPADAPPADGPLSASGVTPYVAVDESGRVAVHTRDGGEREVIIDEQLWSPEAAVSVTDVAVRPGSTAGEVSGVVLLATEGGPELAWFRAAAGATATSRMEGPFGLGEGDTDQRDAPTFSPDGRHIAWVEPAAGGAWTLRTVGVADDGPTNGDASFGLDVEADRLRLAAWRWDEVDGATARGAIHLVDDDGRTYVLPVERQGDGALAVQGVLEAVASDGPPGTLLDLGFRGEDVVSLVRTADGLVLRQPGGDVALSPPLPDDVDVRALDLDVLADVAVVTDRASGWAVVVDRGGGAASLEVDAATTHGFDPVR